MKIAIHSFKGGTGKTTICANLATLFAQRGMKVGVIDCDLTAAGLHILFDIKEIKYTLNDILWGKCKISDAILDITKHVGAEKGKLYFIPASLKSEDIIRVIDEGYDPIIMTEIFKTICNFYSLDILLIDTHPGISSDILLILVACNPVILSMRYDEQDFAGSGVALEMVKRFGRRAEIILNMVPTEIPLEKAGEMVRKTLKQEVIAAIPFYEDLLLTRSLEVFVLTHPNHEFAKLLGQVADRLLKIRELL